MRELFGTTKQTLGKQNPYNYILFVAWQILAATHKKWAALDGQRNAGFNGKIYQNNLNKK